jgi:hypothetical protein
MKRALKPLSSAAAALYLAVLTSTVLWATSLRAENGGVPKPASPSSNAAPAQIVIPKSVFVIPSSPREGTDPFFPKVAVRPVQPQPRDPAPPVAVDLHLKGFSGTPQQPLAIINNKTFAAGEEGDLNLASGRVHLRCVEIKSDSVVIEIGGERRELRLRQGL